MDITTIITIIKTVFLSIIETIVGMISIYTTIAYPGSKMFSGVKNVL